MYRQQSTIAQSRQRARGAMGQPIARRRTGAPATYDWRASAVAAYQQIRGSASFRLQEGLATRLQVLTGRAIAPETIFVDPDADLSVAVVDGVIFRMRQGQVRLLRPCAECGVRQVESHALVSRADLGYALSDWEPRCPDCQPEDPADAH